MAGRVSVGVGEGRGQVVGEAVGEEVPWPREVDVLIVKREEDLRGPAERAGVGVVGSSGQGHLGRRSEQSQRGGKQR